MSSIIGEKPCIDADGNYYKQVKIGSQTWTSENLKTTKYRDGTPIPLVTDGSTWAGLSTAAYSYYDNDPDNVNFGGDLNITTLGHAGYGNLYNWFAVDGDAGTYELAPEGWHVPTDDEYIVLRDYLGGSGAAGGKMKSTGTIEGGDGLWYAPNTGATNEGGFTALPGGSHSYNGNYYNMGLYGYFWSSTEDGSSSAGLRFLVHNSSGITRISYGKRNGFSVRCVRDN